MTTFEPCAAIHGYTEAPPSTSVRGADHVAPQSCESLYPIELVLPFTFSQVATRWFPPAFATTGKAAFVEFALSPCTLTFVKVRAPLLEPANLTPPEDVA